jgi:hypothetical protein
MKNYEYHVLNNTKFHTKEHGFVFGLIHTANTTLTQSILLDNMIANTDLSSQCAGELKSIRVRRNLGSEIANVQDNGLDGYTIYYENGDICN